MVRRDDLNHKGHEAGAGAPTQRKYKAHIVRHGSPFVQGAQRAPFVSFVVKKA